MTKKDFEAIASALARGRPPRYEEILDDMTDSEKATASGVHTQWRIDCEVIAIALGGSNPRFDRDRFIEACNA